MVIGVLMVRLAGSKRLGWVTYRDFDVIRATRLVGSRKGVVAAMVSNARQFTGMSASIQGLDRLPGVGSPHVQSRLDQGFLTTEARVDSRCRR
jgi:hypothetical protein